MSFLNLYPHEQSEKSQKSVFSSCFQKEKTLFMWELTLEYTALNRSKQQKSVFSPHQLLASLFLASFADPPHMGDRPGCTPARTPFPYTTTYGSHVTAGPPRVPPLDVRDVHIEHIER